MINNAMNFAKIAHDACGHKRRHTGEPYWRHLERVAGIVESVGGDADMISAAWLHDILEDTQIHSDVLLGAFGSRIFNIVMQLTNDKHLPREERKAAECERFKSASAEVKTIKLADILDNGQCFLNCGGTVETMRFMKEKEKLLHSLDGGNDLLYKHAKLMVKEYFYEH